MRCLAFPAALMAALILASCTSTEVLEPTALVSEPATPAPSAEFPIAASPDEAQPAQTAAIVTDARIRFTPVVGATDSASAPLAARLSTRAGERGLTLVGADDGSATHVMRGYFSALSEGGGTTVVYVWDVLDPDGTRVHRIQGQARSHGTSPDGWSAVEPATMESIADRTVEQLASWLSARPG